MSKAANHLHRYKKVNLSRTKGKDYFVYRCTKPGCSHYIPIHMSEGTLCECNRCGNPMVIGKIQLNGSEGGPLTKPHCSDCVVRKGKLSHETITDVADFLRNKEKGANNPG